MAKTSAQRQAEYRARRPFAGDNGERRLSMWISTGSALALGRLSRRYRVTKQDVLERLLQAEDDRVGGALDPESNQWAEYYSVSVTR